MSTRSWVFWNVTISQLGSSILVPDMDRTPSSAPNPRLWLTLLFPLYDLFWLHVCEVGLDVTKNTLWDPHFQRKSLTPAEKWVMMITNSKHQSKTPETSQNSQAFGNKSSFISKNKENNNVFFAWKQQQGGCSQVCIMRRAHRIKHHSNAKEEEHNQLFTKDLFVRPSHTCLLNTFISYADYNSACSASQPGQSQRYRLKQAISVTAA